MDEVFGELRSLMEGRPSAEAFGRVCALVDEVEEAAPGLYAERWEGYLSGHLARWPASACSVTLRKMEQLDDVLGSPWRGLVRGVDLHVFFELSSRAHTDWLSGTLRGAYPELEHLGIAFAHVRKKEVQRACQDGVFDGLRSLAFGECTLKMPTFGVLVDHLGEAGTLRRLESSACVVGDREVAHLVDSALAGQLEHLDLRWNQGIKNGGFEALAGGAPRFEALKTLNLDGTSGSAVGMAALGRASWGEAFESLALPHEGMRAVGLEGFVDGESLGLLFDRWAGRVVLELSYQGLKDEGVEVLARSAELAEVDVLRLEEDRITTLAALAASPYIEGIEEWHLYGNALKAKHAASVLEVVRRARPRVLDLGGAALGDAFVEELCGMSEADGLERLRLTSRKGYGERALEAILGWPRAAEVESFVATFDVPSGSEVLARALETGRFEVLRSDEARGTSYVRTV